MVSHVILTFSLQKTKMNCSIVGLVLLCLLSWTVEGSSQVKLSPRAKGIKCRGGARWKGPSKNGANGEGRKVETGNTVLGSQERTSFEAAVLGSSASVLFLLWMKDPKVNAVVSDICL